MSTYEISKSSLLSLKAEILRKQEELSKAKAENDVKIRNLKKNSPLDLKNKGVEQRQTQDVEENENLLKKSREALEAKSKLYEKLSKPSSKLSATEAECCQRYLVRFDRKKSRVPDLPPDDSDDDVDREEELIHDNYAPPSHPDEEWVEYVDCLGRTRTCLRKDLDYLKSKDKDLKLIVDSKRRNREKSRSRSPERSPERNAKSPELEVSEKSEENELLSNDMRRQILRKQWEEEEENLRNKSDIHYQDILFDEARTHGVGYYGFSKDEDERSRQQEALKKLREETKDQQKKSQDLKAMREKQLAARVRAATNRKRERMGLPPLEDNPEPTPPPEKIEQPEEKIDEQAKRAEEKRKKYIRPWDMGKDGVRKEHYEHTQEEWVDKKRKERPSEFAPPSTYKKSRADSRRKYSEKDDKREGFKPSLIVDELSENDDFDYYRKVSKASSSRGATIPPPTSYESEMKHTRKGQGSNNVSDSIEAGLKFLREQLEMKQTPKK